MNPEEFKNQIADLVQEIGNMPRYCDKMMCLGTAYFCLHAMEEALMKASVEAAEKEDKDL